MDRSAIIMGANMWSGDSPGQSGGVIVFDHGRVVHAEFFGLIGETAFAALLVAAHGPALGEAHGSFVFHQLENGAANGAKTIHCDLKQLLLSAAAEIDEGRTGAATAPLA